MTRLRSLVAGAVSPRHRRWRRLLHSLTLDPDRLTRPLPPPGERDFLICGSPRTGTALLSAELFRPPEVITVMEPWDGLRLPPAELFSSLREELARTGVLSRGRLDVAALRDEAAVRWCADGARPIAVDWTDQTLTGVKLPAFWRYLDLLPDTRFLLCVRDPEEVLASYLHTGGRLAAGYDYDVAFNAAMNSWLRGATDDSATRRALLYEYIGARTLPYAEAPNVHVVRYERWFTDPHGQLADVAAFLGVDPLRPQVRLRAPRGVRDRPEADRARDLALVRAYCQSARAWGYGP